MKRIAVIGAGGIAKSVHLPSIAQIEDCRLIAVCDLFEDKARAAAERYGVERTYTLYHEMLANEELDGVFCLVDPDRMYRVAYDCLMAGKHVFMEKPAGLNAYQTASLARVAREAGKVAVVGMNRRHIPVVQTVLTRMRELTPITQVDGMFVKNSDIGRIWHYASAFVCDIVHAIDLVRYIAGSEPARAATVIAARESTVDNAWSSVIAFENGITGTLRANYRAGARVHTFEIHGPYASAFINVGFGDMSCEATILHFGGKGLYSMASGGMTPQQTEHIDGKALDGDKFHQFYGYLQEDRDFIRAMETGAAPLCGIDDAVKTMEMVEMLLRSAI